MDETKSPTRARGVAEIHRRPTPLAVNVEKFARDSDQKLRVAEDAEKTPTAPPPPYHPASIGPEVGLDRGFTDARTTLANTSSRVEEHAARVGVVRSQLTAGGLSHEEAANVIRLELGSLEAMAMAAQATPFAEVIRNLRFVVEELGGIAGFTHRDPLRVFVVDDHEDTRANVSVAVESLGHTAYSVGDLSDLARLTRGEPPDAILVSVTLRGPNPEPRFCDVVRELAHAGTARVVVYTRSTGASLDAMARECGAQHSFRAAAMTGALATHVAPTLDDLGW